MPCSNCKCDKCLEYRKKCSDEAKKYREATGYSKEYYRKNREKEILRARKHWEAKCKKNGKTPKPYRPLHQRRKDFLD